jgi:hypothetical protein
MPAFKTYFAELSIRLTYTRLGLKKAGKDLKQAFQVEARTLVVWAQTTESSMCQVQS